MIAPSLISLTTPTSVMMLSLTVTPVTVCTTAPVASSAETFSFPSDEPATVRLPAVIARAVTNA